MIRLLVIIAVVGFLTCVVTLGGAAALGGRDVAADRKSTRLNSSHW